jgi:hypothetical protein
MAMDFLCRGSSWSKEVTMSNFDSDDLEMTGYFLPEHSQFRLKKLREYAGFLSRLAQPRRMDEEQGGMPEIRVGEVAICLELLAEQVGLVLDEISWPAQRYEGEAERRIDAEPEAAGEEIPGAASGHYLFGVTLEQIDTLQQLITMISAHGDVVTASDDPELADHTLPVLGHAIVSDATAVRRIIHQVERQGLGQARGPQAGVDEAWAAYHVTRRKDACPRDGRKRSGLCRTPGTTPGPAGCPCGGCRARNPTRRSGDGPVSVPVLPG